MAITENWVRNEIRLYVGGGAGVIASKIVQLGSTEQDYTLISLPNLPDAPLVIWDESEDAFSFSKGVNVTGGLTVSGTAGFAGAVNITTANGIDINPGSDIDADLITVGVAGAPTISWDESEDAFAFSKGLRVVNGQSVFGAVAPTDTVPVVYIQGTDGPVASFPSGVGAKDWLLVENNGNCNVSLIAGADGSSSLKFYDPGAANTPGSINYLHASDSMTFETAATTRLELSSSGMKVPSLAGTGTRTVVVDANGVLSAP